MRIPISALWRNDPEGDQGGSAEPNRAGAGDREGIPPTDALDVSLRIAVGLALIPVITFRTQANADGLAAGVLDIQIDWFRNGNHQGCLTGFQTNLIIDFRQVGPRGCLRDGSDREKQEA